MPQNAPRRLGINPPAGVYLHWPFCSSKCSYCDFITGLDREPQTARYSAALLREIEEFDGRTSVDLGKVDSIYWGGGTPSLISLEFLQAAMFACQRTFNILPDVEVSLEANPGTLSREKARDLLRSGINRISLGIESFHNSELRGLNRRHSVHEALQTFEMCRDAGVQNISCDLICGLPCQSNAQWEDTLLHIVRLGPEHISIYLLELHPRTRLYVEVRAGKTSLPPEEEVALRYYRCLDVLEAAGYEHYEISNFARKGFCCRHNLKYWNDGAWAGFGVGAHFSYGGMRFCNDHKILGYLNRVEITGRGLAEVNALDFKQWLGDYAMTALRKRRGIDLRDFRESYGFFFEDIYAEQIDRMLDLGMLEVVGGHLQLTRAALIVSNEVFEAFI